MNDKGLLKPLCILYGNLSNKNLISTVKVIIECNQSINWHSF